MKKHLVIGLLANVDAGKTTLSEAILYNCNAIKQIGRVDHGDAFLDTYELEKTRGITIFSKQAVFETENYSVTLLDTPGHADFSTEMERALSVLDMAVLIVSAADGITGQLRVLIRLLKYYKIPTVIFINKMDQAGADKEFIITELKKEFSTGVTDFEKNPDDEAFNEEVAVLSDELLDNYLNGKKPTEDDKKELVKKFRLFPLCTGSALRNEGIDRLIKIIDSYVPIPPYEEKFSAKIFKISREAGKKLCWLKITGGSLKVKQAVEINGEEEKADEIRIYSGAKYKAVNEVVPGMVCAVTGLSGAKEGMNIGAEEEEKHKLLESVMRYKIILPPEKDINSAYKDFMLLEEENPSLKLKLNSEKVEISIELMGTVQAEIIKHIVKERFSYEIEFGSPEVVYKETIAEPVEGVGHFEPLRHYAEVHLLLEPGENGSGIRVESRCSTDNLAINYQKLIVSLLETGSFKGVLTGAELTDVKITLLTGKSHKKHTEGGDFREAVYRAVRQGLMSAENVLLEPFLQFSAIVPEKNVGRLMNDISEMGGSFNLPQTEDENVFLEGKVPAASFGNYGETLTSYTGGQGRISLSFSGYEPCHNSEKVLQENDYDPERDIENPSSSVFCMHGAGTLISWDKVREYMHVESGWGKEKEEYDYDEALKKAAVHRNSDLPDTRSFKEKEQARRAADEELKMIFERTYGPIKKREFNNEEDKAVVNSTEEVKSYHAKKKKSQDLTEYLLIDGYNIIFAWDELKKLAAEDLKAARDRLLDIASNYAGMSGYETIVVFDAYKVPGGQRRIYRYNNINVIFTEEAETADLYIEQAAKNLGKKYSVMVATSDAIEQVIVFGAGAIRLSAANFYERVKSAEREIEEIIG